MWLLITNHQGHTHLCDYFPDAFLFEVIAMVLEEEGVYGKDQERVLTKIQTGRHFLQSKHFTFILINPDETD